jgi:diguanylate cyclase (GGDEF)-like protein/PAS domain S-box-containing protein
VTHDALAAAPMDPDVQSMQRQLFRYAQDFQELMEQQRQLHQRYEMVLQFMGREVPETDVLSTLLMETAKHHVVTEPSGEIRHISGELAQALGLDADALVGQRIHQLMANPHDDGFQCVLSKFAKTRGAGGIEQRRFALRRPDGQAANGLYNVMAMQITQGEQRQIGWFFKASRFLDEDPVTVQDSFIQETAGDVGILVTNPFGTICTINSAFSDLTGFEVNDVVGENPRLLGSGRHDTAFFQDFWLALLDTGCWNGQMLNRRKNGKIFLTWQSVRMVEDAEGNVISYICAMVDISLRKTRSTSAYAMSLVHQDPLTGLFNRRYFEETLRQALEMARKQGSELCVLFVDIEGVKRVSDEYGFSAGDQTRKELGLRMQSLARPDLSIALLGSEEFAILIPGTPSQARVRQIANEALGKLAAPLHIDHQRISVKPCIGAASYPRDGSSMGSLLKHAHAAMYAARRAGTYFSLYQADPHPERAAAA